MDTSATLSYFSMVRQQSGVATPSLGWIPVQPTVSNRFIDQARTYRYHPSIRFIEAKGETTWQQRTHRNRPGNPSRDYLWSRPTLTACSNRQKRITATS